MEYIGVVKEIVYDKDIKLKNGRKAHLWRAVVWDGREEPYQVGFWREVKVGDVVVLYNTTKRMYGNIKEIKYKRSEILSPPSFKDVKESIENSIPSKEQRKTVIEQLKKVKEEELIKKALELGVDIGIFLNALKKTPANVKKLVAQIKKRLEAVVLLIEELERCL